MRLEQQKPPETELKSLEQEIESIESPPLNLPGKEGWPDFLKELKEKAKRLEYLEGTNNLFTTDRVPRFPEGVRHFLLEALDVLVIPKKIDREEEIQFRAVLNNYSVALNQWQEELLDRAYNKFGEKREIPFNHP